jgi:hypothetical protein
VEKANQKLNPRTRGPAKPGSIPPKLPRGGRSGWLAVAAGIALVLILIWNVEPDRRQPPPVKPGTEQPPLPAANWIERAPPPEPEIAGPRAASPVFSKPGGTFDDSTDVELAADSPAASIHFTLDGSEPRADSPVYSEPISITRTTLLKARCYEPGLAPSVTAVQTYTMLDEELAEFSSNLPLVIVNTFGSHVTKNQAVPASLLFIEAAGERTSLSAPAQFAGRGEVKLRGHSSLRFPKRSYALKITDSSGKALETPVLGMPRESDWILYAPYSDKTLMRDVLAYELSNKMGRYAARTRFVEVFVVTRPEEKLAARHYAGVYVFEEKIKRGPNRVDIVKLTPEDKSEPEISGGYLFKRDHLSPPSDVSSSVFGPRSAPHESGFTTSRGLQLLYVEPKERNLTRAQKNWLTRYMNQFEKALYGSKFKSPSEGYAKYLDVDSFLDQFWLVELSKNIDGFRYSCFMQKDRGGKLRMEPVWDWNLSFGNANYHQGWMAEGWYWPLLRETEVCWYRRLSEDPDFVQKEIDRWTELRRGIFAPENLLGRVDELAELLSEAQERNFQRWPILGRQINPNRYVGKTYQDEIRWMKNWIKKRVAWIDSQFLAAPEINIFEDDQESGLELRLAAAAGSVFYTIDGSDPRLAGGGVSPKARRYKAPFPLEANVQIFSRAHDGENWSGPTILEPER